MSHALNLPVPAVSAFAELVDRFNPGVEDIGVIIILAKTDHPPVLTGTVPPEQMHDLFQWLIDHQDRAHVEVNDMDSGHRADN